MKKIALIAALSAAVVCTSAFGQAPSGPANPSNTSAEDEALYNTPDDWVPAQAAADIQAAFKAGYNKNDPKGQAKLDQILADYGYDPGTLSYRTDNLSNTSVTENKMKGKKHKNPKKGKKGKGKQPKSPKN